MALFSTNVQPQSSHLIEFMAGKMFLRDRLVHPDPRKGKIYLYQSDDGLMHFCWKDATTGTVEDDLIIFPGDTEFIRVTQCTTGRVYLLSFKNPPRKFFYWMQAFKDDKDDDHCKKVNDLLNHPPAVGPGGRRAGHEAGGLGDQMNMFNQLLSGGSGGEDLQRALQGVDRRQMMQLLNLMGAGSGGGGLADLVGAGGGTDGASATGSPGGRRPPSSIQSSVRSFPGRTAAATANTLGQSSTTGTTSGAGSTGGTTGVGGSKAPARPITTSELSQILSGINAATTPRVEVDLETVLTAKNVEPVLLADENVNRKKFVERLVKHLPNESPIQANEQELVTTLRCPQFRQAVATFGAALHSGQLGPFMRQFGFSTNVVNAFDKGDAQSIAEMIEAENEAKKVAAANEGASATTGGGTSGASKSTDNKEKKEEKKKDSEKKDKDEDEDQMELD